MIVELVNKFSPEKEAFSKDDLFLYDVLRMSKLSDNYKVQIGIKPQSARYQLELFDLSRHKNPIFRIAFFKTRVSKVLILKVVEEFFRHCYKDYLPSEIVPYLVCIY